MKKTLLAIIAFISIALCAKADEYMIIYRANGDVERILLSEFDRIEFFTEYPALNPALYPNSMSAMVVTSNANPNEDGTGKLVAFIGDEVRGEGFYVGNNKWYVLIKGDGTEKLPVVFKYIEPQTGIIHRSEFTEFIVDSAYGTADHPKILKFEIDY